MRGGLFVCLPPVPLAIQPMAPPSALFNDSGFPPVNVTAKQLAGDPGPGCGPWVRREGRSVFVFRSESQGRPHGGAISHHNHIDFEVIILFVVVVSLMK